MTAVQCAQPVRAKSIERVHKIGRDSAELNKKINTNNNLKIEDDPFVCIA